MRTKIHAPSRTTRPAKNNVIPFPVREQPRIEVWQIIYVGQSNDGYIRQTVVLRGRGERDMRHLSQDNNKDNNKDGPRPSR